MDADILGWNFATVFGSLRPYAALCPREESLKRTRRSGPSSTVWRSTLRKLRSSSWVGAKNGMRHPILGGASTKRNGRGSPSTHARLLQRAGSRVRGGIHPRNRKRVDTRSRDLQIRGDAAGGNRSGVRLRLVDRRGMRYWFLAAVLCRPMLAHHVVR